MCNRFEIEPIHVKSHTPRRRREIEIEWTKERERNTEKRHNKNNNNKIHSIEWYIDVRREINKEIPMWVHRGSFLSTTQTARFFFDFILFTARLH